MKNISTVYVVEIIILGLVGLLAATQNNIPRKTKSEYVAAVSSHPTRQIDCSIYIEELYGWVKGYYEIKDQLDQCIINFANLQNEKNSGCLCIEPHCE